MTRTITFFPSEFLGNPKKFQGIPNANYKYFRHFDGIVGELGGKAPGETGLPRSLRDAPVPNPWMVRDAVKGHDGL